MAHDAPEFESALQAYPVKLEHLLRVTKDGPEILSEYPVDPELVPA